MKINITFLFIAILLASSSALTVKNKMEFQFKLPDIRIDPTLQKVIDIVSGIIFGIIKYDLREGIKNCADDIISLLNTILDAGRQFKDKQYLDGVKSTGSALVQIPKTFMSCKSIKSAIYSFMSWCKMFTNPVILAKQVVVNLIIHGHELPGDIKTMIHNFNIQNWFIFGRSIGVILTDLVGDKSIVDQLVDFLKNVIVDKLGNYILKGDMKKDLIKLANKAKDAANTMKRDTERAAKAVKQKAEEIAKKLSNGGKKVLNGLKKLKFWPEKQSSKLHKL